MKYINAVFIWREWFLRSVHFFLLLFSSRKLYRQFIWNKLFTYVILSLIFYMIFFFWEILCKILFNLPKRLPILICANLITSSIRYVRVKYVFAVRCTDSKIRNCVLSFESNIFKVRKPGEVIGWNVCDPLPCSPARLSSAVMSHANVWHVSVENWKIRFFPPLTTVSTLKTKPPAATWTLEVLTEKLQILMLMNTVWLHELNGTCQLLA